MRLEDYFDFLELNDIRIKGHRIGIESVLYEYLHRAQTAEEIAARFPTLTLEEVYATILYFLHNEERMRAYLTAWIEHGERQRAEQNQNPTPVMQRLRSLRADDRTLEQPATTASTV